VLWIYVTLHSLSEYLFWPQKLLKRLIRCSAVLSEGEIIERAKNARLMVTGAGDVICFAVCRANEISWLACRNFVTCGNSYLFMYVVYIYIIYICVCALNLLRVYNLLVGLNH
jgi:hypothetical protein